MTGTGKQIADYFESAALRLPVEMLRAENDNARTALNTILRYSSGELSSMELALMGHPYAPGRTPPQDPAVINVQSEEFLNSWQQDGPRVQEDGSVVTTFENTSPHARFLETGTTRMIPRPLIAAVQEEITPVLEARRDEAVLMALGMGQESK